MEISESHLDTLLSDTTSTLDLLSSLTKSFKDIEAQTTTFQRQCEGLLDEQKRIDGLASDLDHNLKYYNYLEPVTRRLNAPGAGSFVRSKEFSEMLARVDDCLEYMTAHVRSWRYVFKADILTDLAHPSRSIYLPFPLPTAHDKRPDVDPCQLRRWIA